MVVKETRDQKPEDSSPSTTSRVWGGVKSGCSGAYHYLGVGGSAAWRATKAVSSYSYQGAKILGSYSYEGGKVLGGYSIEGAKTLGSYSYEGGKFLGWYSYLGTKALGWYSYKGAQATYSYIRDCGIFPYSWSLTKTSCGYAYDTALSVPELPWRSWADSVLTQTQDIASRDDVRVVAKSAATLSGWFMPGSFFDSVVWTHFIYPAGAIIAAVVTIRSLVGLLSATPQQKQEEARFTRRIGLEVTRRQVTEEGRWYRARSTFPSRQKADWEEENPFSMYEDYGGPRSYRCFSGFCNPPKSS